MLTEGAISALAVILPAALVWDFASIAGAAGISTDMLLKAGINITATPNILRLSPATARFYTAYGLTQAIAWSKVVGLEAFPSLYKGFRTFAV